MKKFIVTAAVVALALVAGPSAEAFTYAGGLIKVGTTGTQVYDLQKCLIGLGDNPSGNLDGIFGNVTKAAVMSFQAKAGVSDDGIIGPVTGPLYTAACAGEVVEGEKEDDKDMSGSEASLEDFEMESEDDAEEGQKQHVATVKFDVEDGDVVINRFDLTFDNASVGGTADDEPWDVFETLTLEVDGKEIAEEDINDEDDWKDDNGPLFVYRLTGLDYMVEEDEEAEIEVYLTAEDNVDDIANADWNIYVDEDGVRGTDGAGLTQEIGDASENIDFSIDEEGGDEELVIKSSSSDPEAFVIEVDETDDSSWEKVFVFALEAEENDIDLDDIEITVTTGTANYEDVVEDIKLEIDGEEFDDVDVVDEDTTTADLTFDIDEDYTIDADDTVKVAVWVEIKQQGDGDSVLVGDGDDNYDVGETIQLTATAASGDGVDDVSDTASIDGEEHSLEVAVAGIDFGGFTIDKAEDDASGTISFEFTVDAGDSEEDIDFNVANKAAVNGGTDDVRFTLSGTDTAIATASITLLDGDATSDGSGWVIDEGGEAAVFVVDITFTTVDAGDNGTYRVKADSVEGVEIDETSSGMTLSF